MITLIPKVKSPTKVSESRPISLCNVLYKIIAKVLANRLKPIFYVIILPAQSGFVPSRSVTNNFIEAYESMHTMKSQIQGKAGFMALKLDMSKIYDTIDWFFLKAIMER